ncbi:MAG: type II toxin-antitoxin system VapC family toxin [Desulfobulbaceae bacterium]|nr:type II toxin-antitoxin system VapC family toxin [Desulfobulbaceae bacterium]
MVAIDTNILVRFLTRDDEKQFQKVMRLFAENEIFIPATVILETEWVLRYSYGFSQNAILDAFTKTFGLPKVTIQDPDSFAQAIDLARKGLDFADALHLASAPKKCASFATFDTALIRKAKGLSRCRVTKP